MKTFNKYWSVLVVLALLHSEMNYSRSWNKTCCITLQNVNVQLSVIESRTQISRPDLIVKAKDLLIKAKDISKNSSVCAVQMLCKFVNTDKNVTNALTVQSAVPHKNSAANINQNILSDCQFQFVMFRYVLLTL